MDIVLKPGELSVPEEGAGVGGRTDTGSLAAEGLRGEMAQIESLVRAYRPRLLRFVTFAVRDQDLAESIVQDCFLKAYITRESFRGECSVSTWLFSIANNLIRDHVRTKKFQFWRKVQGTAVDLAEMASSLRSQVCSPEVLLLEQERAMHVTEALAGLSVNQRTVFLLRFSEDMTPQEIAESTGMAVNTVKTHLHRALVSVRKQLGGPR